MSENPESPAAGARAKWLMRPPWLFFGFFLFYLSFTNAGYFDIGDAEERFLALRALIDTGNPKITRVFAPVPFVPIYSLGPGISALPFIGFAELLDKLGWTSIPRHQLQVRSVLVGTAFYSALWIVLIARLAQLFTPSRRKAVTIAMLSGLATLIFPYSKSFQSENLVGLLITSCVYLAIMFRRTGETRHLYWMGSALGAAFLCKNELALGIIPLGAFVIASRVASGNPRFVRKLPVDFALIALGALPGIAIVLWYNWIRYGSVTASGYANYTFSHGFISGMYLQWVSAGKGLLWYSPILFVGFAYVRRFWNQFSGEAWLPLSWWLMMTVLYAHWANPVGDTALGPRFMVSYLPFGILPLVSMIWKELPVWWRCVTVYFVTLSGWITLVCALVPFPLYQSHRWNHAPNEVTERLRRVAENWYHPDFSPLPAYHAMLGEGTLDLWGVRFAPGEAVMVIQPFWWLLLGASITCLLLAWQQSRATDISQHRRRGLHVIPLFLPVIAGCLFGIIRLGYPKQNSLKVTWERPGWATHRSLAQAIEFKNVQDERAFHVLFYEDMTARWSGEINIPVDGLYQFEIESQNPVRLKIGDRVVVEVEKNPEQVLWIRKPSNEVVLEQGWHDFKVDYRPDKTAKGPLIVKWRPPGAEEFQSLKTAEFAP